MQRRPEEALLSNEQPNGARLSHKFSLPPSESDTQLALDFSRFFQSKVLRIREELDGTPVHGDYSVEFHPQQLVRSLFLKFNPVDELSIRRYIRELNKTYCSLDPINVSKITCVAFEAAAPFIASLVNKYFECIFVTSEKVVLLRPTLKKPSLDVEDMNSFRPVSNLSFLSKIVERAMLDQLLPFLEENRIIPKNQSAYHQFHSTETALCKIHNDLVINVCSGKASLLVLLDLSAAFDTVDHDVLLADLFSCGIREDAHSLLKSYLTNRFQRTSVGASLSEPVHLQFGVPQGSVLGPILFTLCMSSLATLLEAHNVAFHFYADDTQIYIRIDSIEDVKEKLSSLINDIKILMNLRSNVVEEFDDLELPCTHLCLSVSARNLGIIFDSMLNFKNHINSAVKTCNYHIRNLYSIRKFLDQDCLITLVHSLIVSRVDYCNYLCLGLPNYLLKKLQSIMNKSARLIFSVAPRVPTTRFL